ncbi:hypothetical protein PUN28_003338 [Cardiocondyla obscurior]|uniref:Uncharacterized protein n=1 Tax=Cardiocondyla obscurior TaxID=286306 RepID=A0AAW2GII6_9HYME
MNSRGSLAPCCPIRMVHRRSAKTEDISDSSMIYHGDNSHRHIGPHYIGICHTKEYHKSHHVTILKHQAYFKEKKTEKNKKKEKKIKRRKRAKNCYTKSTGFRW